MRVCEEQRGWGTASSLAPQRYSREIRGGGGVRGRGQGGNNTASTAQESHTHTHTAEIRHKRQTQEKLIVMKEQPGDAAAHVCVCVCKCGREIKQELEEVGGVYPGLSAVRLTLLKHSTYKLI